jgi:uroporphyrinogen decarboxylase
LSGIAEDLAMTSRERVLATIRRRKADRIPVYGWVAADLSEPITRRFGSVAAFEDRYEFDYAHLFGGGWTYTKEAIAHINHTGEPLPRSLLEVELHDPNDMSMYQGVIDGIRHHKEQRGRFVYVQTPGIFECLNGAFGIGNHLAYLLMYEDQLHEVYRRQAQWNKAWAMNCMDLGVDMVHVSDDWGSQHSLMFSTELFRRLIKPYHWPVVEAVKKRGGLVSLHSDGNVSAVVDDIIELGFDVVHPWQESAGMSLQQFHDCYRDKFTVMGGLDIQTTIGFGKLDYLRNEILRVLRLFRDGGLLFCTSHFVTADCTMEELAFAYDLVYETVRKA